MDRNDLLSTAGETLAYAEDYLDTRIELLKLNAAEKGAQSGAKALTLLILSTVGLFAMGCFTVALALWISGLVGSLSLGFLIVGLVYVLFVTLLFIFRKALLTTPLLRTLITQLFRA